MYSWLRRLGGGTCFAASCSLVGCGVQVPTIKPLARSQLEVGTIVDNRGHSVSVRSSHGPDGFKNAKDACWTRVVFRLASSSTRSLGSF
jgi:hypothetical protein